MPAADDPHAFEIFLLSDRDLISIWRTYGETLLRGARRRGIECPWIADREEEWQAWGWV